MAKARAEPVILDSLARCDTWLIHSDAHIVISAKSPTYYLFIQQNLIKWAEESKNLTQTDKAIKTIRNFTVTDLVMMTYS